MEATHRSDSVTKPRKVGYPRACNRCSGQGRISGYAHVLGGICFRCNGFGGDPKPAMEWTYPADWSDEAIAEHVAKREAQAVTRKAAAAERKQAKADAAKAEFVAAHEDVFTILTDADLLAAHGFLTELARAFERDGNLSVRQIECVLAVPAQVAEQKAREAAEAERLANAEPVIEGLVVIEGEIVGDKWVPGYTYSSGDVHKMIVLDDRGFKVYGTWPRSLDVEIGDRVSFLADVEMSRDDRLFGFFKRPRQARKIEAEMEEAS